jgi:hypothetical protein
VSHFLKTGLLGAGAMSQWQNSCEACKDGGFNLQHPKLIIKYLIKFIK